MWVVIKAEKNFSILQSKFTKIGQDAKFYYPKFSKKQVHSKVIKKKLIYLRLDIFF